MPFQKPNINIPSVNNRLIATKLITKIVNKIKLIMKINKFNLLKSINKKNHHSIINCCQIFLTTKLNISFPIFLIHTKLKKNLFLKKKELELYGIKSKYLSKAKRYKSKSIFQRAVDI